MTFLSLRTYGNLIASQIEGESLGKAIEVMKEEKFQFCPPSERVMVGGILKK